MRRRKMVAAVAVAAVVAAFASTGSAGARVGSDARGVTSDSIKVAALTDSQQPEAADGAKVVFDAVNDAGGINGRKIDYLGGNDDKGDATQDQTIAKRLVQQDQVFAVVPTVTPNLGSSGTFFQQQHVPFFGWGIATGFCNNPYAFGFTGCIVPPPPVKLAGNTWGKLLDTEFKGSGETGAAGKTAAVVAEDDDSGKTGVKVIAASAKSVKMKVTYEKASLPGPPATIGDYSPFVNDIMTSNNGKAPDAVFLVVAFTNVLGMAKGLIDAGYTGIITNAVAYDPRLVGTAKGQTAFTQFAVPESASTNPAMAKIVAQIKKYAPDAAVTQGFLAGYFSADFFVKAVKAAGKNLTPEALAKAAGKMTYAIKNVVGPTKFPAGLTQGTPCGSLVKSNGTGWEIAAPYACYSNITLKGLKPVPYK